jgi:hypothetical protein
LDDTGFSFFADGQQAQQPTKSPPTFVQHSAAAEAEYFSQSHDLLLDDPFNPSLEKRLDEPAAGEKSLYQAITRASSTNDGPSGI